MRIDPVSLLRAQQHHFDYDSLTARPLFTMVPPDIDQYLYQIAIRSGKTIDQKYELMDKAMADYGFFKMARGTNRSVYRSAYDPSVVIKVGIDRSGLDDARSEFHNQQYIKPFCAKTFEVSPSGIMGLFERVNPISYKDEFISIAGDVFDMLVHHILNKYIMADIGASFYMNYGLRLGFGPVLLDYPYLYKIDGDKLRCGRRLPDGSICNGLIDYDDTFDFLHCDKCGKKFLATDIAKKGDDGFMTVSDGITIGGMDIMSKVIRAGRVIYSSDGVIDKAPEQERREQVDAEIKSFAGEKTNDYLYRKMLGVMRYLKRHNMVTYPEVYAAVMAMLLLVDNTNPGVHLNLPIEEATENLVDFIYERWEAEEEEYKKRRQNKRGSNRPEKPFQPKPQPEAKPEPKPVPKPEPEVKPEPPVVNQPVASHEVAKQEGPEDPVKKNRGPVPPTTPEPFDAKDLF